MGKNKFPHVSTVMWPSPDRTMSAIRLSLHFAKWACGERKSITKLNAGIALCRQHGDNRTRELLEQLLEGSEHSEAWLDAQLNLVTQVGEAHYLA